MARGDKSSYSSRQRRKAEHIESSYEDRGVSKGEAERRAWATVNKQEGGARGKSAKKAGGRKSAAKKGGGRKTAAKQGGARKTASRTRSAAAKKAARTLARRG